MDILSVREHQASITTVTPTTAKTASSSWNPHPGQLGGLEADQPRPGDHRQLAGIPVATPLPPPRQLAVVRPGSAARLPASPPEPCIPSANSAVDR